jgi:hypothetical protein
MPGVNGQRFPMPYPRYPQSALVRVPASAGERPRLTAQAVAPPTEPGATDSGSVRIGSGCHWTAWEQPSCRPQAVEEAEEFERHWAPDAS